MKEPHKAVVRVVVMASSSEEARTRIKEAFGTDSQIVSSYILGTGRGNLTEDEQNDVNYYLSANSETTEG